MLLALPGCGIGYKLDEADSPPAAPVRADSERPDISPVALQREFVEEELIPGQWDTNTLGALQGVACVNLGGGQWECLGRVTAARAARRALVHAPGELRRPDLHRPARPVASPRPRPGV